MELETHVFVQDAAPEVLKAPLPAFDMAETLSDDLQLSIPVEVSYAVINKQLQTQLAKSRFNLPDRTGWRSPAPPWSPMETASCSPWTSTGRMG